MLERIKNRIGHPWVVRGAQYVVGAVFVFAGLAKIGDPQAFAAQIHNFRLAPIWSENLIAVWLPWIEVLAGGGLIVGVRRGAASWLTAAMMVLFTVAVAQAWARGLDIECGCFGTSDATRVGRDKLIENLGLTALAFVATWIPTGAGATASTRDRDPEIGGRVAQN